MTFSQKVTWAAHRSAKRFSVFPPICSIVWARYGRGRSLSLAAIDRSAEGYRPQVGFVLCTRYFEVASRELLTFSKKIRC